MKNLVCLLLVAAATQMSLATVVHVPSEQPTIGGSMVRTSESRTMARGTTFVFADYIPYELDNAPFPIIACDLDNDSLLDLVAGQTSWDSISIFRNTGNQTFERIAQHDNDNPPFGVAAADVNGDNWVDIIVAKAGPTSSLFTVFFNNGQAEFDSTFDIPYLGGAHSVVCHDMDLDGDQDVVLTGYGVDSLYVFLNDGNALFEEVISLSVQQYPRMARVGLLNSDTIPDIVCVNSFSHTISVFLADSLTKYSTRQDYEVGDMPEQLRLGDFDLDGCVDIVVVSGTGQCVSVFYNNCFGEFDTVVVIPLEASLAALEVADFDADGKLDIVVNRFQADSIYFLRNLNGRDFADPFALLVSSHANYFATGDFDNDCDPDIATTNTLGSEGMCVLFNYAVDLRPIESVFFRDETSLQNVVSHQPDIMWSYCCPSYQQDSFEVAIGTDNDWSIAEMWEPGTSAGNNTSIVYEGEPLCDGETYWLRMRLNNWLMWSDWFELSFRMNSVPSAPVTESPIDDALVDTQTPDLVVANSSDAEGDSLFYIVEVSPDSFQTTTYVFTKKQDDGGFTTVAVDSTLQENARYWWRVNASDYYEQSAFSDPATFYVNSENTPPSVFQLILPPDTSGAPVATLTPEFIWSSSTDIDPFDSVHYALHTAVDSNFTWVSVIDSVFTNVYMFTDSLSWGTRYWWKVKAEDQNGGETWSSNVLDFRTVTLGDADGNGMVNIADVVYLINYIFAGGPAPNPLLAGDVDCNGMVNIADVVYLINFIFGGGPAPCADFP